MKQRNPIAVALLPFVTFGIYSIYWAVKTKEEMKISLVRKFRLLG